MFSFALKLHIFNDLSMKRARSANTLLLTLEVGAYALFDIKVRFLQFVHKLIMLIYTDLLKSCFNDI